MRLKSLTTTSLVVATCAFAASAGATVTKPFPGITLVQDPGPTVMAVVDLCAAGVSVRASKYAERDQTVGQWGRAVGVQVATNADFFEFPGWSWVIGRARGEGVDWPPGAQQHELTLNPPEHRPVWEFGPGIAAHHADDIQPPQAGVTDMIGGHNNIIVGGVFHDDGDAIIHNFEHRTGLGISADRRTLYLLVTAQAQDGKGLANLMITAASEAKAPPIDVATNNDSGGSSQFYAAGLGDLVSSTRPVGNSIGIFAKGTGVATSCPPPPPPPPKPPAAKDASSPDTGSTAGDGGGEPVDAGDPPTDAGAPTQESGTPTSGDAPTGDSSGCACGVATRREGGLLAVVGLGVLFAGRRGRRRAPR